MRRLLRREACERKRRIETRVGERSKTRKSREIDSHVGAFEKYSSELSSFRSAELLKLSTSLQDLLQHSVVVVGRLAVEHSTEDSVLSKSSEGSLRRGADLFRSGREVVNKTL